MWQFFDVVEFQFVEMVFIVCQGQDQVVIWYVGGEIGKVVMFVVCVVIVVDQEDVVQFFMIDQIDECIGSVEQGLMVKIDGDEMWNFVIWKVCYLLCLGNDWFEVIVFKMVNVWLVDDVMGLDMVVIVVYGWVDNVVRSYYDWVREVGEFDLLILLVVVVVIDQMFEFMQFWIVVCGQYFIVSVDVNVGVFGLFQQVVEIFQIVIGDQNVFVFSCFDVDLSWCWVIVFGGFIGVQDVYYFEVYLVDFYCVFQQCVYISRSGVESGYDFVVLGVNVVVVLIENVCVFYICCCVFQIVQVQQMQVEDIFVNGGFVFIWDKFCCLMLQFVQIVVNQLQIGYWIVVMCIGIYVQVLCF